MGPPTASEYFPEFLGIWCIAKRFRDAAQFCLDCGASAAFATQPGALARYFLGAWAVRRAGLFIGRNCGALRRRGERSPGTEADIDKHLADRAGKAWQVPE
jgi:hypothetical protein